MLHHYNYSTSLSYFLTYRQLGEETPDPTTTPSSVLCDELSPEEEDSRCRSTSSNTNSATTNKSFTIASILGLNNDKNNCSGNGGGDVVNLSLNNGGCSRIGGAGAAAGTTPGAAGTVLAGHYPLGHAGCPPNRQTVRGLKHLSNTLLQAKKSCKSKRVRTIFTPEQLERLEAEFERQQYMVGPERLYLAHTLQLTEAQVKVWFQNRRIKWRKHHLELTHQRLAVLKQQQMLLEDNQVDVQDTNSSSSADNT